MNNFINTITSATVTYREGFNWWELAIEATEVPSGVDFVYKAVEDEGGTIYLGTCGEYRTGFASTSNKNGFGGHTFNLRMADTGEIVDVVGPWSGRPSVYMAAGADEYMEVTVTNASSTSYGLTRKAIDAILAKFNLPFHTEVIQEYSAFEEQTFPKVEIIPNEGTNPEKVTDTSPVYVGIPDIVNITTPKEGNNMNNDTNTMVTSTCDGCATEASCFPQYDSEGTWVLSFCAPCMVDLGNGNLTVVGDLLITKGTFTQDGDFVKNNNKENNMNSNLTNQEVLDYCLAHPMSDDNAAVVHDDAFANMWDQLWEETAEGEYLLSKEHNFVKLNGYPVTLGFGPIGGLHHDDEDHNWVAANAALPAYLAHSLQIDNNKENTMNNTPFNPDYPNLKHCVFCAEDNKGFCHIHPIKENNMNYCTVNHKNILGKHHVEIFYNGKVGYTKLPLDHVGGDWAKGMVYICGTHLNQLKKGNAVEVNQVVPMEEHEIKQFELALHGKDEGDRMMPMEDMGGTGPCICPKHAMVMPCSECLPVVVEAKPVVEIDADAEFIIGGTGPRSLVLDPERMKLVIAKLVELLNLVKTKRNNVKVIVGGAEGFDEALARACVLTNTPYKVYLPSKRYGTYFWVKSVTGVDRYDTVFVPMCEKAEEVVYTDQGNESVEWNQGIHNRNRKMVDHSSKMWILPSDTRGTKATVTYIMKVGKPFFEVKV